MSKKFFETEAFANTKAEWDKKLEDSGFDDIESTESDGIVRSQVFSTKSKLASGPDYYDYCQLVLRTYPFQRDIDRVIFELHTEGVSLRRISEHLKKFAYKSISKTRVDEIISQIKQDFGRQV